MFGFQQIFMHDLRMRHRHQHRAVQQVGPGRAQCVTDDGAPVLADVMQLFAGRHGFNQTGDAMHQTGFVKVSVVSDSRGQVAG